MVYFLLFYIHIYLFLLATPPYLVIFTFVCRALFCFVASVPPCLKANETFLPVSAEGWGSADLTFGSYLYSCCCCCSCLFSFFLSRLGRSLCPSPSPYPSPYSDHLAPSHAVETSGGNLPPCFYCG